MPSEFYEGDMVDSRFEVMTSVEHKIVILQEGTDVYLLTPTEARTLGSSLIRMAEKIEPAKPAIVKTA